MRYTAFGSTHRGLVRSRNEDAFGYDTESGWFAVADGLGGLPDGARASQMAVEIAHRTWQGAEPPTDLTALNRLLRTAHARILRTGRELHPETGMATTLTLGLIQGSQLLVAHAGDSAIFLSRKGSCRSLTEEHTLATLYALDHPGEPIPAYLEHTLTQCLGAPETFAPELASHALEAGDRLLWCTDGVNKCLSPEEIGACLSRASDPRSAVEAIQEAVLRTGAPDNLTQLAVFCAE